jgi:T5SS/PEP-CTERM-associated repeat protein
MIPGGLYLGYRTGSSGSASVSGIGSRLANQLSLYVGDGGSGELLIDAGGEVYNRGAYVGDAIGSSGMVSVNGSGSTWSSYGTLSVGNSGTGTVNVVAGGQVESERSNVGVRAGATGAVTVTGESSKWIADGAVAVGVAGTGVLSITGGGLVGIGGTLTVDSSLSGGSFVNMATGGMLALRGDADDSLGEFLELVQGSDAIRFWDATIADWAPLTSATYGDDYTLSYFMHGDLAGYTQLTVGVNIPEPSALMMAFALLFSFAYRQRG